MSININKVAVLGAGVMGSGIAAHIAGAGIPVCLLDIVPPSLTEQEKAKGLTLEHKAIRNKFAQTGKDRVTNPKNRLIYDKDFGKMIQVGNFTDNMDMLNDCDWIIEVIVENLDIKKNLMKEIEKHSKNGVIVSSNTSGVSINKIVEDMPLEFRQNFLGTHFFNPPRYMNLFELIPGNDTSPEVTEFLADFGTRKLGKGVVMAKDTPNFIGNRIGTYASVNALKLMEKYGFDIPTMDQLTGPVMGRPKSATFRTMDLVGIDIMDHVVGNVRNNVENQEEKDAFQIPEFCKTLISKGHLGDKTKKGFYKKVRTEKGKQVLVWDPKQEDYVGFEKVSIPAVKEAYKSGNKYATLVYGDAPENKFAWDTLKSVLLYSASKVPEIADDFKEIDNAMKWGFNWEIGPFAIWDAIDVEKSVAKMKEEGETVPAWIEERLNEGMTKFYDGTGEEKPYIVLNAADKKVIRETKDTVLHDLGDGVVCLEFTSRGNAITEDIIASVYDTVQEVEKNYKGLVIGNQSSHFSSGADLGLMAQYAGAKDWDAIEAMVTNLQKSNMALKYCKKPVVAAPYGMTLGGGAEIALHAHKIVGHAELYMGLVEAGVGLVPVGGGAKELLFRAVGKLGKVSNGEMISHVKNAWQTIAMANVSGSAHEAVKKGMLVGTDSVVMSKDYLISEAKREVLNMYEAGFRPNQPKTIKALGSTGKATLMQVISFMKDGRYISEHDALIATKLAEIMTGGDVPCGVEVTEQQILDLEKQAFLALCKEEKTQQRIEHMAIKGKPLRN